MRPKIYTLLLTLLLAVAAVAQTPQTRYAEHSRLASGKWVKVKVTEEGVYQLTPAALQSMGFSNPAKVSLYGYNLPFLPETDIENLDDDLAEMPVFRKADGTILFYSRGVTRWWRTSPEESFVHAHNPYSDHICYFLTENAGQPAAWTQADEAASAATTQTTYMAHALYEKDGFSFINAGRTLFDPYDFATGASKTYRLDFDGPSCGDIRLNVRFGAAGAASSTLSVSVGDEALGNLVFAKLGDYTYADVRNKSFTLFDQTASSLSVTLKHTRGVDVSGHLDYLRATYETPLRVGAKQYVAFSPHADGSCAFEVQGATSGTRVWNVTRAAAAQELRGALAGTTYKASASGAKFSDLFVAVNTDASFPAPQTVGSVANQDLHALTDIDLLIIVPASGKLTEQANRLAAAHTLIDKMKCAVVPADQIYNEFSAGSPDVTAYRRLLKMLYDRRFSVSPLSGIQPGGMNVLLFGNCFWDNRLLTSGLRQRSQDDCLLIYESENGWSHTKSYPVEEYITLLADGKGVSPLKEHPDCGVGRMPVTTPEEARRVVDKVITYIQNTYAGAWHNTICMMADDGNAKVHMQDAEHVLTNMRSLNPDYRYKRIYWDSYEREQTSTGNSYPSVHTDIDKMMEEGALIMNYTGHGVNYSLSHEQVLRISDFQEWDSPRLPLWFAAACDVAPFDMNTPNLAADAVLNSKGGAIAFVSAARTVFSSANRVINRNFMNNVLADKPNGERFTIGEALAKAKADIIGTRRTFSEIDSINKAQYVLLGDPAIRLPRPTHRVRIDKLNGLPVDAANPPAISAGQVVSVEGHVETPSGQPDTSFHGVVSPIVYDNLQHIVCKNNAGEDVEPFDYEEHTRVVYAGGDSVRAGSFTFSFPVPLDINYSGLPGLMLLHAVNNDHSVEANGSSCDFLVGGTAAEAVTDTLGPTIAAFSDGANAHTVHFTSETPTLRIELYDESGINTTGNGLGHDIVAIVDGRESTTFTLNSYFTQTPGDYRSGEVSYVLPALEPGRHTLVIRAFDTLNNMGQAIYSFEVVAGLRTEHEWLDLAGRRLQTGDKAESLPTGVYVRRKILTAPTGVVDIQSEKVIVTQ